MIITIILLALSLIVLIFLSFKAYRKRKQIGELISGENEEAQQNANKLLRKFSIEVALLFFSIIFLSVSTFFFVKIINKNSANALKSEVVFLLDVSNSMKANDLEISRLKAAKLTISNIVNKINANIALVCFSEDAEVIAPMSDDKEFINQILQILDAETIENQGTNLELALRVASKCFTNKESNNIIVLLTDAEDHSSNLLEEVLDEIRSNDIIIKCIGFGTQNGSKIPMDSNTYLKDWRGQEVITKLNLEILKQITPDYNLYPVDIDFFIKKISLTNQDSYEQKYTTEYYISISLIIISIIFLCFSLYLRNIN